MTIKNYQTTNTINGKRGKFSTISLGSKGLAQAVIDENETSLDFPRIVRLKEYKKRSN